MYCGVGATLSARLALGETPGRGIEMPKKMRFKDVIKLKRPTNIGVKGNPEKGNTVKFRGFNLNTNVIYKLGSKRSADGSDKGFTTKVEFNSQGKPTITDETLPHGKSHLAPRKKR